MLNSLSFTVDISYVVHISKYISIYYCFITVLTMWRVDVYVYCLALLYLPCFYGQSIKPYILCEGGKVTVASGSSGMIEHLRGGSAAPCALELSGFDSTGHVSIPGIDLTTTECQPNIPKLKINNIFYCVTLEDSTNLVFIATTSGRLEITLQSAPRTFALHYYSSGESFIIYLFVLLFGSLSWAFQPADFAGSLKLCWKLENLYRAVYLNTY